LRAAAFDRAAQEAAEEERERAMDDAVDSEDERLCHRVENMRSELAAIKGMRIFSRSGLLLPAVAIGLAGAAAIAVLYFQAHPVTLSSAFPLSIPITLAPVIAAIVAWFWIEDFFWPWLTRHSAERRAVAEIALSERRLSALATGEYDFSLERGGGGRSYYKIVYDRAVDHGE
tara:strand:- start:19572 stop:20090 length:519 start_codon:yes stop_codon:yes gene_type:complete